MNTIFAPVDFSIESLNALSFAAELAKRASARLILVHIYGNGEVDAETKDRMMALEADYISTLGPDLKCESLLRQGNFLSELLELISVEKPDLIVMGTKGASGLKKILIGSNTVKVIAKISVPVLVIPKLARFKYFIKKGKNRVVLATDLEILENESALFILKELTMLIIEPKLRVLSIREPNTQLSENKRIERDFLVSYFKPEIKSERVTVFSNNVIEGINYYLDKNIDSGLFAMIARDSGELIQKHYTREMAARTKLPLLILHDDKI